MEYNREINLEFITVGSDIQQSSKAHGLTYQILQWGYTATVCVRVYVHVCACVCMHTHADTDTHAHTATHRAG